MLESMVQRQSPELAEEIVQEQQQPRQSLHRDRRSGELRPERIEQHQPFFPEIVETESAVQPEIPFEEEPANNMQFENSMIEQEEDRFSHRSHRRGTPEPERAGSNGPIMMIQESHSPTNESLQADLGSIDNANNILESQLDNEMDEEDERIL